MGSAENGEMAKRYGGEEEEIVEVGEDEVEEEEEDWDDWNAEEEEDVLVCLFCDANFKSLQPLLEHCTNTHLFDLQSIRNTLALDFYSSFKLINYIRSQVAENRCWSCGITCHSNKELQNHLHETISCFNHKSILPFPWADDKYLQPFMQDDCLLHTFAGDEDGPEDYDTPLIYKEELMRELMSSDRILDMPPSVTISLDNSTITASQDIESPLHKPKNKNIKVSFANVAATEIKNANDNYFGAYSSFGIHKEMISDKVRMDAYSGAILNNSSLMNRALVMDVGCGTGILSLFAAKAGASRVIAIEASEKMAKVATQIAKDNGLLWDESSTGGNGQCTGVVNIVQSMVEELDEHINIPPHSVDVLLSEWMGYCLLYESMLSSVLYARDRWLKPGGAILPDTATIFVAGFGRGGTSIQFWENVYGFNLSCIGKEVCEDAARLPIVDVVDASDLVTDAIILQNFDLLTMKSDEMDFTASFELKLKLDHPANNEVPEIIWCYGVVLWFETGFTNRFCKDMPTVLSTSPYTPRTHWSQTILTFREPIAMTLGKATGDDTAVIGTDASPAVLIQSRISIARAAQHRSIDISLEITGVSSNGQKHSWPVQIFNL